MTVTLALNDPVAAGVKVTSSMQLPLAGTEVLVLHVVPLVAMAKSVGLVPPSAILEMVRAEVVGLLRVKDWAALVVFSVWAVKVRLEGESVTAVDDEPVNVTVCPPLAAT